MKTLSAVTLALTAGLTLGMMNTANAEEPSTAPEKTTAAIKDIGPKPNVFDINAITEDNTNYRQAIWTGKDLQVTVMDIEPGKSIGLEMHPQTDQFIRIESGEGLAEMGNAKNHLTIKEPVKDGWVVVAPAGTWHDVKNTGDKPLKLYAIYTPVHHAAGIVQATSDNAEKDAKTGKDKPPVWTHQPKHHLEDKH